MGDVQAVVWAFKFAYHRDQMNSAVHCEPVRWSPMTVALARWISTNAPERVEYMPEVEDVT
jgi:hypothetical protein